MLAPCEREADIGMRGSRNRGRGKGIRTLMVWPAADVAPYQCFRRSPSGKTAKTEIKISTFEAGMCMKTNKSRTKCPEKFGHLRLSFGHFRLTDTNFTEIRGEFTVKRRNFPTKSPAVGSLACGLKGGAIGLMGQSPAPTVLWESSIFSGRFGAFRCGS